MIISKRILVILLLGILVITVWINVGNSSRPILNGAESDPPLTGDWIIDDSVVKSDETINLNGSIVIEETGLLNLTNVRIVFRGNALGATNGSLNITVLERGTLAIESNSEITTDNPSYLSWIKISKNAVVTLTNSTFENVGYDTSHPAIQIESDSVVISNCTITPGYDSFAAIYVDKAFGVQLLNNTIYSNQGSGIYSQFASNLTILNNYIRSKHYGIYLDKFQDGNLTIANNIINSEEDTALHVFGTYNCSGSELPLIINNEIEQAVGSGIYVDHLPKVNVLSNYVTNVKTLDNLHGSIHIVASNHSIVSENYVFNSGDDGIVLEQVDNGIISSNFVNKVNVTSNTAVGINVTECNNSLVFANQISLIGGDGIHYSALSGNNVSIISNILSSIDNRGIYINKIIRGTINDNQITNVRDHGISIYNSSQLDIRRNTIMNSQSTGISFTNSTDINVTNCDIKGSRDTGISISNGIDFQIEGNNILENYDGISLYNSNHSTIRDSYFGDIYRYGLYFSDSSHNNSNHGNIFISNYYGIYSKGNDSIFNNNSILLNFYGAYFHNSSAKNFFYFNDFLGNAIQAIDFGTLNNWSLHLSPPDIYFGNYWSDYNGEDLSPPFGFGDSPYNITGNRADFYPLMNINTPLSPPSIDNPSDLTFLEETTGHFILWVASTNLRSMKYDIIIDGDAVSTNTWNGSSIVYIVDSLPVGTYSVTCVVYDLLGQSSEDTVTVIVQEIPIITTFIPPTTQSTSIVDQESPLIGLINEIVLILMSLLISFVITIVISKTRRGSN